MQHIVVKKYHFFLIHGIIIDLYLVKLLIRIVNKQ